MYLPLLSISRENKPAVAHSSAMHSTNVPLARLYGGVQAAEDITRTRKEIQFPAKVHWEPVKFKDVVVYIRRLTAL